MTRRLPRRGRCAWCDQPSPAWTCKRCRPLVRPIVLEVIGHRRRIAKEMA